MDYVALEDVSWTYSEDLDISISVSNQLPRSELADVVYAKLSPGQTLKLHSQLRAGHGYEAFFFFQGASIRVLLANDQTREFHTHIPFHLTFHDDEAHGVSNLGPDPLLFEVLCAPRHVIGEERMG
jgi:hypothetical protein